MKKNKIPKIFEFVTYKLEPEKKRAVFSYKIYFKSGEVLEFKEILVFPKIFKIGKNQTEILDSALINLHLILGVSYYKIYCPSKIVICYKLDKTQAQFWNEVYQKGLGEFSYRNKINLKIKFPYDNKVVAKSINFPRKNRSLLGIGGGKDSIVSAELLKRAKFDFDGFVVETQKKSIIINNVTKAIGIKPLVVKRYLDEKVFSNLPNAYNGHVPVSAIFAFVGFLTAILYDYRFIISSNEFSSNFGNIKYQGEDINHQWSKSQEFESLIQKYARKFISPDIKYFSLLRPYNEIRIAKMFSKYKKYFSIFSSCNKNFRVYENRPNALWCGECPKCAFVFLMLAAFLSKKELIKIFGYDMLADKKQIQLFGNILGFGKMKPFDCVGTFEEAQAALYFARNKFKKSPVIKKYLPIIKNPQDLPEKSLKTNIAPTLPDNFKFLGIEKALILGYGVEGRITKKYLSKNFSWIKIGIADKKNNPRYLEKQSEYDLAVKTPSLSRDLVIIPYTTATNIFFSQIENIIIGVTGTKGKGTTASLIYSILKEAGKKVTLLGNIGKPMLEALMKPIQKDEIFVLELSSYQLNEIGYSPHIAVVINLFPEHMNYHGGVDNYYAAKKNIIKFQNISDYFIYNNKNAKLRKWAKETQAKAIKFNIKEKVNFKSELIGKHNEENIKAAIVVAKLFGICDQTIQNAVLKFKPLPHRLESVGQYKGIKFYDDAISTTPESTIAALKAIPKVATILLGGEDRGYDFSLLEKEIRKREIKNIVLFPDSGKRIFKSKKELNILETSSMEEAVKFGYENTPQNFACLLSTASPSYSVWNNFEEKGDLFQKFVKKIGEE